MVDTVNMPYHHGHLADALVEAGYGLAREGGPDAVVLRAATRAAGVSHNAAYRHFADRDDLLAAVGRRAMASLADLMAERQAALEPSGDPAADAWAGLEAAGRSYVEFALAEPGLFRTAFGVPDEVDPAPLDDGPSPFTLLNDALDAMVAAGAMAPERRPGAEFSAWSIVHGLSSLLVDGPLRSLPGPERRAVIDRVFEGARQGI